ncbi:MAG: HAMP domain-containing protein [Desulfobacteraceae bacterium]|nr:MAG: HAMP domain-containing protein [Desulfobacteraceae bacterium]
MIQGLSISRKLFIIAVVILLLTVIPLFYVTQKSFRQLGDYASRVNQDQISTLSRNYLEQIAHAHAKVYNEVFKRITAVSALLARKSAAVYNDTILYASSPLRPNALRFHESSRMFYSPDSEPVITAYWGDRIISDEVKKELLALTHMEPFLVEAQTLIEESLAAHMITLSGIGKYHTRNPVARARCFNLPPPDQFDLRSGEPVTMFTRNPDSIKKTRWTHIYKDDVIDGLMMTASSPVIDRAGTLRAITGIDVPVDAMIRELTRSIPTTAAPGNDTVTFSFLISGDGNIIAFPKAYFALFGLEIDLTRLRQSDDIFQYRLSDSTFENVRKLSHRITQSGEGLVDIDLDGGRYVLGIGHLETVEWKLVVVSRESDLISSVSKTQTAMNESLGLIWKNFISHSLLILLFSIVVILFIIRLFIQPIKKFVETTRQVANGDFSITFKHRKTDELGMLFDSFNEMVQKLKLSDRMEKEHTRKLERLNQYLVYSEEKQRKKIAADLHDSVVQTLGLSLSRIKDLREHHHDQYNRDLNEIQSMLEQAVREIRTLIYNLAPPILDDFDIDIAIGVLIDEFNTRHNSHIHYTNRIIDIPEMDRPEKITLYRVASELITNIIKHSGTDSGHVELSLKDGCIALDVQDEGAGFDVNPDDPTPTEGFGLYSLSERIANFGGVLHVSSHPGQGTRVELKLPIDPAK